jgi:hypothetical protein
MGYLGYKPADKPLTAADITDSIITSAKIVDGTITNSDVASSIITGQTAETSIAGGENKSPFAQIKSGKNPFELTPDEEKKISTNPAVKQAAEKSGMDVTSVLKGMMGGATNPSGAFGTVGGQ